MAVTVKKDYLLNKIRDEELLNYIVKDGSTVVDKCDDAANTEELISRLEDTLSNLEGNYVEINVSEKSTKQKASGGSNYKNFTYRIKLNGASSSVSASDGINGTVLKLMNEKHAVEMQMLRVGFENDKKFDALMVEIKAAKEQKEPDALNRAIEMFAPLIAQNLGIPIPTATAPALGGTTETNQERILSALAKWKKFDPDYIAIMERIVALGETDIAKYNMAKTML